LVGYYLIMFLTRVTYLNDNSTGYVGGFTMPEVNQMFDEMRSNYSGWCETFAREAIAVDDPNAIAEFHNLLLSMNPTTALSSAKVVFLTNNRQYLPVVKTPVTTLNCKYDPIVPDSVAQYMKHQLPHGELEILDTMGHFLMLTDIKMFRIAVMKTPSKVD
ncbi:hypothetical protein Dimus_029607, partial [Dionaea muscipula]